jgi:hypothetical protein
MQSAVDFPQESEEALCRVNHDMALVPWLREGQKIMFTFKSSDDEAVDHRCFDTGRGSV